MKRKKDDTNDKTVDLMITDFTYAGNNMYESEYSMTQRTGTLHSENIDENSNNGRMIND